MFVAGIPAVYYFGVYENKNVLVLDLLGKTLFHLFQECGNIFSLKTTLMLALQMLDRLEFIHSRLIIHRDIKPANFLLGTGDSEVKKNSVFFNKIKNLMPSF